MKNFPPNLKENEKMQGERGETLIIGDIWKKNNNFVQPPVLP